jgi:hypothetical protein
MSAMSSQLLCGGIKIDDYRLFQRHVSLALVNHKPFMGDFNMLDRVLPAERGVKVRADPAAGEGAEEIPAFQFIVFRILEDDRTVLP